MESFRLLLSATFALLKGPSYVRGRVLKIQMTLRSNGNMYCMFEYGTSKKPNDEVDPTSTWVDFRRPVRYPCLMNKLLSAGFVGFRIERKVTEDAGSVSWVLISTNLIRFKIYSFKSRIVSFVYIRRIFRKHHLHPSLILRHMSSTMISKNLLWGYDFRTLQASKSIFVNTMWWTKGIDTITEKIKILHHGSKWSNC